ncbi:MAG TPA: MFS transporter [Roseomonas sp.]|nr:MFS transporter [Roseomonas sp.]
MNAPAHVAPEAIAEAALPAWLTMLLAGACGLIVANLYYAQPLIGPISAELGLSPAAGGLIVTMSQVGYGAGLLLIVPLGDLVENRRLVLAVTALAVVGVLAAALSGTGAMFLAASLVTGFGSVAVQILVPYAAHLAPERVRGRVVGNVMSGLMLGIMLARPVASFITALWSWHAVFVLSALVMVALCVVLRLALPARHPVSGMGYGALLASMGRLACSNLVLRRRALYHAGLFGAFSLFWTTTPLLLSGPQYGLSQSGIALFALVGVAGVVSAPLAGRLADRGWTRPATGIAMLLVALSFLMTRLAEPGSHLALALLVAAALLLDLGVSANAVLGQRAIFSLGAEFRARLNGIYMATFFIGGAIGSALGGWSYAAGGWPLTAWVGFALPLAGLAYYATEGSLAVPRNT